MTEVMVRIRKDGDVHRHLDKYKHMIHATGGLEANPPTPILVHTAAERPGELRLQPEQGQPEAAGESLSRVNLLGWGV